MALNEDKIKDLFSTKLNDFEPQVPDSLWEDIDQLLSEQQVEVAPIMVKKDTTLRKVFIGLAVAASIALGVFLSFDKTTMPMPQNVAHEGVKTEDEPKVEYENNNIKGDEPKEATDETLGAISERNSTHHPKDYSKVFAQNAQPKERGKEAESDLPQNVLETEQAQHGKQDYYEPKVEERKNHKPEKDNRQLGREKESGRNTLKAHDEVRLLTRRSESEDNGMSFSVKTNAGVLSGSQAQRGKPLLFSEGQRSASLVALLASENKDYEMSHSQPISVGATISKRITNRVSLETGVMFTHLSSKVKSNSEFDIKEQLKFGYIGVPLSVNYNFYELGKARFFLSAGFMAQKDIYGRYTSRISDSNELILMASSDKLSKYSGYREPDHITKNVSQPHWQLSTHMTVGASYPIYQKLNIYTSIGGAYYFDANNRYKTIYSERQFQLDLNLGFKFDF